jgi:hypothetical protein
MSEPTPPARPRRTARDREMRLERVFARMLEGQSYQAIAEAERLTVRRVRQIVQETLDRWDIDPIKEYRLLQIARLDGALQLAQGQIAQGKLAAVPHLIKLLERLDAYHGDELYAPPIRTPEQHLGVMVRLKLERLAASRMVVSTPQIAAPDANAASGKENVG